MSERRASFLAVLFLAGVAVLLFIVPLARREVLTFRDHSDYFVPLRFFTATHLRAMRLPLWNPYNASGEAWMANPQTAVFYPPAWMFMAMPLRTAYVLFLAFHLAVLGAGAFLLFARGASRGAALFGAIALMLSGPVLSMLDINDNLVSFAWLPWVILAAVRAREHERLQFAGAVVLALCFLAGEPFIAAVAALIYVAIVRRVRDVAVTALASAALSAVQLLPFLEWIHGSDRRGGFAGQDILRHSMPLVEWWRLVVPPRLDRTGYDAALSQHFIPVVYAGVLTVALAIVGIVVMVRARRAAVAGWITLLVLSMAIAAGPSLLVHLPLTVLRYPARMIPFGALAVVALAVAGWERIRNRRAWLDALLIVVVAGDLVTAALPLLASGPVARVPYDPSFGRDAKIIRIGDAAALRRGASREAWISGYLNLIDLRFDSWTAAPVTSRAYGRLFSRGVGDRRVIHTIGAGYMLASRAFVGEGIVPIGRRDGVYAARLSNSEPMARLVLADGRTMPVRSLALDSSHARVIVNAPSDALVVLTQCDAPGWRVVVDGIPSRSEIVDGIFRGVRVPRGSHDVRWTFLPRSLLAGAAVTAIAIVALLLIFFLARSR